MMQLVPPLIISYITVRTDILPLDIWPPFRPNVTLDILTS